MWLKGEYICSKHQRKINFPIVLTNILARKSSSRVKPPAFLDPMIQGYWRRTRLEGEARSGDIGRKPRPGYSGLVPGGFLFRFLVLPDWSDRDKGMLHCIRFPEHHGIGTPPSHYGQTLTRLKRNKLPSHNL